MTLELGSGFGFLWSHNRKWVVHQHVRVHDEDGSSLMFNDDNIVYPPLDRKDHLVPDRDFGELSWSPDDSWVSFYEVDYPSEDHYIVLVSPNGNFLRTRTSVAVDNPDKIEWTDSSPLPDQCLRGRSGPSRELQICDRWWRVARNCRASEVKRGRGTAADRLA